MAVIIADEKELDEKIKKISEGGAENLHIVSDFDRTLTTAFVNGRNTPSLISILRDGNYLGSDYAEKAHVLFNKYHKIEIDLKIPLEQKKKAMLEWWEKHFDLLIKSGLNKKDVENAMKSGKIKLRDGCLAFLDFLYANKIPLLIISSNGLGGDAIKLYLEEKNKMYENIHVISNTYEWDKKGNATRVKKPLIHTLNKEETAIKNYPVFEFIKNRKNVLLLGDSTGDVGMVGSFDYKNLIKIGFLNEDIENSLPEYKKKFDIIITEDGSMNYVNNLLKELIGK